VDIAERAWTSFRRWRWWQQGLLWLVWPIPTWIWALRPRPRRRVPIAVATIATLLFAGAAISSNANEKLKSGSDAAHSVSATTSTTRVSRTTPTRRRPKTTFAPARSSTTKAAPRPTTTIAEADRKGDHPNKGALYPGRPGAKATDHERPVGPDPVRFSGFSVWVLDAALVQRPSPYNCCEFIRAHVKILNRDSDTQRWFYNDFSIQTPNGEEYSATTVVGAGDKPIGISGGLVHGGFVEGDVWFHVGDERGLFFILWEPQSKVSNDDRGVWGVRI